MIAAIYARKSTEQNGVADEAKSVTRQVENARGFAESKGWTVADEHVFVDDGISGAASLSALRAKARLLDVIKSGLPFDVLVMQAPDRLSRRDGDEAFGELKAIARAGVGIWFYADGTRFEFGTFATNTLGFLRSEFAAEYRRAIATKTAEAMKRKARRGHVTGGRCFGYVNVDVGIGVDAQGRASRSHVERRIEESEAEVVREIFDLAALGWGRAAIAKHLNDKGRKHPRTQQGGPGGWCQSSVREALYRDVYRGQIVWGKTKKRDAFGEVNPTPRPASEWMRIDAPQLRIVSDQQWNAAHERLANTRDTYLRSSGGKLWGRPLNGTAAKYLGTGLLQCGCCGAALEVRSRAHGKRASGYRRVHFYACSAYWRKGTSKCRNSAEVRMAEADRLIFELVETTLLHPAVLEMAISKVVQRISGRGNEVEGRRSDLVAAIADTDRELLHLTSAIAAGGGGNLASIIQAIGEREARKAALVRELAMLGERTATVRCDPATVKSRVAGVVSDWQTTIRRHIPQARSMLRKLLKGRLTVTPEERNRVPGFRFHGAGTIKEVLRGWFPDFPQGVASPICASWNQLHGWLSAVDGLRRAA